MDKPERWVVVIDGQEAVVELQADRVGDYIDMLRDAGVPVGDGKTMIVLEAEAWVCRGPDGKFVEWPEDVLCAGLS